jgi:hypothetical protein
MENPQAMMQSLQALRSSEAKRMWRNWIYERDSFQCVYCGSSENLTIDHCRPKAKGGQTLSSNCVTACRSCNQSKGSSNWLSWMRATFGITQREDLILSHIN